VAKTDCENLFAALDIGSHTTRLLIAQKAGSELVPLRSERRVTRLAQGFERSGKISEEAEQRNLEALQEYGAILRELGALPLFCGATGVVRRAKNSERIIEHIFDNTSIECNILSEQREAWLSAKGILSAIKHNGKPMLMFDVGGGSTEFVLPAPQDRVVCTSRPIGAATLSQEFFSEDPPGLEALGRAAAQARRQIDSAREQLYENVFKTDTIKDSDRPVLAGTAGTVTTLAAIRLGMKHYVPYQVNGTHISRDWLEGTVDSLALMPVARRRMIAGLEAGREEIILGGAVIVSQILSSFGSEALIVSEAGLLEGLLIELAQSQSASTDLTWRLPRS
jgi:exopolyphosphatase/guanosine-5'-triphosphate,3'-diphosphate pyrophosphatase